MYFLRRRAIALAAVRWPWMTQGRMAGHIDKIVAKADADAVRRRTERRTEREIWFADLEGGLSEIHGSMLKPDAHALDKRLNALADTVCEHDPRSREQRRADALGSLASELIGWAVAAGASTAQLESGPPRRGSDSRDRRPGLDRRPQHAPASEICADGLVAPELIAELAAGAKLVPLIHPTDAAPEPGYVPSRGWPTSCGAGI